MQPALVEVEEDGSEVEAVLDVEGARHPLQELCTPAFVANPVVSGGSLPSITLITGPNASGKTVYLKQVRLEHVASCLACKDLTTEPSVLRERESVCVLSVFTYLSQSSFLSASLFVCC